MQTRLFLAVGAAVMLGASGSVAQAQDEGDLLIGRTGAAPAQLRLGSFDNGGFDPAVDFGILAPVLDSYRTTEPGFDANILDAPGDDFFHLESGADIWLVATEDLDPVFHVEYSVFLLRYMGDSLPLGGATLHRHIRFIVDASATPPFDPLQTYWAGTFRLEDRGATGYLTSAPFRLRFALVDCMRGDVNHDGTIDNGDIDAFVAVLLNPATATDADRCAADTNYDAHVDNGDIDAFVALLLG